MPRRWGGGGRERRFRSSGPSEGAVAPLLPSRGPLRRAPSAWVSECESQRRAARAVHLRLSAPLFRLRGAGARVKA